MSVRLGTTTVASMHSVTTNQVALNVFAKKVFKVME